MEVNFDYSCSKQRTVITFAALFFDRLRILTRGEHTENSDVFKIQS